MDKEFWKIIVIYLKHAFPIMQVLRMKESDDKPGMGFIHEVTHQAKEKIQRALMVIKKGNL